MELCYNDDLASLANQIDCRGGNVCAWTNGVLKWGKKQSEKGTYLTVTYFLPELRKSLLQYFNGRKWQPRSDVASRLVLL